MFRFIHKHAEFEDSFSESWCDDEELNPLRVNRLGYRSNSDIILDFIKSGQQLSDFRNGYTNDSEDSEIDDFFEETTFNLDNLQKVKSKLESKSDSELSTGYAPADSEPAPKNKGDEDQAGAKPVENSSTEKTE